MFSNRNCKNIIGYLQKIFVASLHKEIFLKQIKIFVALQKVMRYRFRNFIKRISLLVALYFTYTSSRKTMFIRKTVFKNDNAHFTAWINCLLLKRFCMNSVKVLLK